MGRANRLLAPRVSAIATSFPGRARRRAQARGQGDLHRQSGAAGGARGREQPYRAARADGPLRAAGVRRQPGRARSWPTSCRPRSSGSSRRLRARLSIVQQARDEDVARVRDAYARLGVTAEVAPFFADLPARIAAAHLVVSRSGASTVAELAAIGRPAILVPLPHALDQDQLANAGVLAEAGGAIRARSRTISRRSGWPPRSPRLPPTPRALAPWRRGARARCGVLDAAESGSPIWCCGWRGVRADAETGASLDETAARHRPDPFRRHRRHRHERHRRGAAQSRLHGARAPTSPTAPTSSGCATRASRSSIGHEADNLGDAEVVVVSTAIKRDNPELVAARAQAAAGRAPRRDAGRADAAASSCVAIAGTHGKTTTTSLVAALLDAGGFDPTVINGGIINAYGTNARLGAGDWMVVEADESDGTFLKLPADVAIVTNIDPEHLDHFKTFEAVQDAFQAFVENVPFYGFAVMCTDHPVVQRWSAASRTAASSPTARTRRPTCGWSISTTHDGALALLRAVPRPRRRRRASTISGLTLPMPGRHNALNATAAIAVARELGIPDDAIRTALAGFGGVQAPLHPHRRMERRRRSSTITATIRSRSPPCCKAARELTSGPGHRRGAAASLHAAAVAVRAVLHLLQRCRRGDRRARLSGRRGADRRRRPRSLVQGLRARGHRQVIPLDGPEQLAGW